MRRSRCVAGAAAVVACLWGSAAEALPIFVDQTAAYRYINATAATSVGAPPANWFMPGFDDSGWFLGNAPFSSGPTAGTIHDSANANGPFAPGPTQPTPATFTPWTVHFDPFLRTSFFLPNPQPLTIWIAVDNGINSMFMNGVRATAAVNAEGAAFRWEHVFDIGAQYTVAGWNTLALQLEDHGVATGFDLMLTGDDASTRTAFTTNPPPVSQVPEPATLSLLGAGLAYAGLAARRRRQRP